MRLRLEDKLIRALSPGDYYDTVVPRLVLRVRQGSRRWVVRYRLRGGEPRRFTVGDVAVMGLAKARAAAKAQLNAVDRGEDPHVVRRAARDAAELRSIGERMGQAVASWLKDAKLGPARRWKGGLAGGTWAMGHIHRLERTLGDKLLSDLSVRDVERFRNEPEAAATRNRALTVMRLFIAWARRRGLLESDPTVGLRKEREQERIRTLTDPELVALIRGFDPTRYGRAVRLLALTGLRRGEVLGARWEWFDTEAGILTIPPEAEKTGRSRGEPRRVALSPQAVVLLAEQREAQLAEGSRSAFIFATKSGERPPRDPLKPILCRLRGRRSNGLPASQDERAKKCEALLPEDVTIHDVRRTVAYRLLNDLGVPSWTVDHVVLGHVRPKLERTYMPNISGKPLNEARAALTGWGAELGRILAGEAIAR